MSSSNLEVNVFNRTFKNPILAASGTFGFGEEFSRFFDTNLLGGFCTKGLTLEPSLGNTGIRVWETPTGLLNSIGLENPGVDAFIEKIYPNLNQYNENALINLGGHSEDDYLKAAEKLNILPKDEIIELNISCPNLKCGGMSFGTDSEVVYNLTKKIKDLSKHQIVVKLTPNVTSIQEIAKACEEAGADGVSLVNTFLGMAVDVKKREKVFDNTYAGLSGPAIKPIALRMVHQVAQTVEIPVIGIGGISSYTDALEFIMCGASLVQVGTYNFPYPRIMPKMIQSLEEYCNENNERVVDLIGII